MIVLLLFAAVACAALLLAAVACAALLLLLLLTRWPAVWYSSFYNFPSEEYKMFGFRCNTHFDTDLSSNSCDAA